MRWLRSNADQNRELRCIGKQEISAAGRSGILFHHRIYVKIISYFAKKVKAFAEI